MLHHSCAVAPGHHHHLLPRLLVASLAAATAPPSASSARTGRDGSSSLGLLFGGDANINNTLRPDSLELPWRGIQGAVQAADFFLINHEATVTDRPLSHLANPANASNCGPDNVAPAGCVKDLRTATAVAPTFKRGGVDFVALSNNHQIKYGGLNGSEGLRDTLAFFNGPDGLPHAGIGETPEDASKPATLARGDDRVTIFAILAGPGSTGSGLDGRRGHGGAPSPSAWAVGAVRGLPTTHDSHSVRLLGSGDAQDLGWFARQMAQLCAPYGTTIVGDGGGGGGFLFQKKA